MFQTFEQIDAAIESGGYTRIANPLEDLLLEELPHEYYRAWRFIWRKTIGWNKTEDHLSLRAIAKGAKISATDASRISWFFHVTQLIRYTPGDKTHPKACPAKCNPDCTKSISHFRTLPIGFPEDLSQLRLMIAALEQVEFWERKERIEHRDFQYTTNEFCTKLQAAWEMVGGKTQPCQ
jgi:hypothetical protein